MSPDIFLIEIIRVMESKKHNRTIWKKNGTIDFKTSITLPGSDSKYVSLERGTIKHGHWTTKLLLQNGWWYEIDDLKGEHVRTTNPGFKNSSVVILILAKDTLF